MKKWFCFYRLLNTHLEFIMDSKEESERWLDFWNHNPRCFVMEVSV